MRRQEELSHWHTERHGIWATDTRLVLGLIPEARLRKGSVVVTSRFGPGAFERISYDAFDRVYGGPDE